MKTLLLVDGSSYLYRAFHALPDLRNRAGEPTGAIYGVINMLRRLRDDYKPDYLACVFDPKGKTFRDDLYAHYKANRIAMPDDLAQQIEPLCELIRALGWPLIVVPGVEADDVIATLAAHASAANLRTVISTGDKDLAQLVDDRVILVNTMSNETLDTVGVNAKFGVPPDKIVDYLSLIGDPVDNVPGVEKVGPKTAAKWIAQYGALDAVIAHADDISGVVGENLRKALDWLPKARELVTVRRDVALPLEVTALSPAVPDRDQLSKLFDRFGFKSWHKELERSEDQAAVNPSPAPAAAPAGEPVKRDYETILTHAQLDAWLERLERAPLSCVDTETTSVDPMQARVVGLSFCVSPGEAAYLPLAHRYAGAPTQLDFDHALARVKPFFEDAARKKTGQNLKYDSHVLANHGIALNGVAHDTLLQSYVLESDKSHDVDSLAVRHLNMQPITLEELAGKGANQLNFADVPIAQAAVYWAEDADITLQLHRHLWPRIEQDERLRYVYEQIEMPVMHVLFNMERRGVLIDSDKLRAQSHALGVEMDRLAADARELAGQPFNLNSPKQIQEILFDQMKLPVVKKTPGGAPSTDEDVLQQLGLDHPLPKLLLDYRGLSKLKSTYTDKLPQMVNPATGRVHTNFAQAVAITGRLSSNDPNLQNIPIRTPEGRRIREAFIAPRGAKIVSADYSQIELRIMAHLSGDASLLAAFARSEDIHRATAAEIFGAPASEVTSEQRRYAKIINFGLIYGMSAYGLATQLSIERSAAQSYMDRYFARYPGVAAYMQRTRETARKQRYVETVFGRRLWLSEISSGNAQRRQAAERAAINAPMQGSAADLIKLAMIEVERWIARELPAAKLILQVHDELILEVPEASVTRVKQSLPALMTGVAKLAVPLIVDVGVGDNWDQAH